MKELSRLNKKMQSVIWLQYIGKSLQCLFLYNESTVFLIRLLDLQVTRRSAFCARYMVHITFKSTFYVNRTLLHALGLINSHVLMV